MSDSDYSAVDIAQLLYTQAQANGVVVRKPTNGEANDCTDLVLRLLSSHLLCPYLLKLAS